MATQSASGDFRVITGNSGRVGSDDGAPVTNDGGSMVKGGNVGGMGDASKITKNIDVNDINGAKSYDYGSIVVAKTATNRANGDEKTDNPDGIVKAKSGGTGGLAYFPDARAGDRNFLLRAAGTTGAGKVNNDSSSLLNSTGREHSSTTTYDGVHNVDSVYNHGTMTYNMLAVPSTDRVPGRTISGASGEPTAASNFTNAISQSASTDHAAIPSGAAQFGIPGELTYMFGGKNPKQDDYKRRDHREGENN
tara:strand:- start:38 stop:787 length:750 start_codon:yes stop_codon:yes gene_type:complete